MSGPAAASPSWSMSRRLPAGAFGYVPTPALVAPIEFTLRLSDYAALGGHMDHVRPLASLKDNAERRADAATSPGAARMKRASANRVARRRQAAAFAGRSDRPDRGGERAARPTCAPPMTPRRGASPGCSTNSARNCRCCGRRPIRRDARCKGVVARRMHAAVAPFAAAALHHADGGGGGQRRGRDSWRDDWRGARSIAPMSTMAATSRCIWPAASSLPSA